MKDSAIRLQVYAKRNSSSLSARCAASLHSHTHYSQDTLSFLPEYAAQVPILGSLFHQELERYRSRGGESLDFSQFHWNPPASPEMVWDSERKQIEYLLGLQPLVSITDHNDISAGLQLRRSRVAGPSPISLEWSVPYEKTCFHLGIHNLPPSTAVRWLKKMQNYRANPDQGRLKALLTALSAHPEILVILNHPFWDQANLGPDLHRETLLRLLKIHHGCIHALEFNGHRAHAENLEVMRLAKCCRLPVVAGGDRHGLTENAVVTLTAAENFEEFSEEIRNRRPVEILLLPHYFYPRTYRALQTATDALRNYQNHPPGRRSWTDRVQICLGNETPRPLSHHWRNGGPWWLQAAIWFTGKLASRHARFAFQLALPERGDTAS